LDSTALLVPGLCLGLGLLAADRLTRLVRRGALAFRILDIPNERSSHLRPTPRGGGLAVAVVGTLVTLATWVLGGLPSGTAIALVGGGLLVAAVGIIDDWRGLRWRHRFVAQVLAAGWALSWLGGFPAAELGITRLDLGSLGSGIALLGIVWGTNFFNFMDGIDGIAASEAVSVGTVGGGLLLAAGQPGLAAVAFGVAGGAAGFLRHNWMPARIFLGDVGSTWLGFTLCTLAVASANAGAVPMAVWGILLGVFVFDGTVTLARRVWNGHPVHAPHRQHAFCRATRWGWSHARVTRAVTALNVVLAAIAVAAWARPVLLLPAAAIGLLVLTGAYRWVERRLPMEEEWEGGTAPRLVLERIPSVTSLVALRSSEQARAVIAAGADRRRRAG
jgi:Fuc2NAc and GlcNAc transferase